MSTGTRDVHAHAHARARAHAHAHACSPACRYGRAILDNVKEGKCIYVGQSAGTVCMSYTLGPITTDATQIALGPNEDEDSSLQLGPRGMLGVKWLFPGLGSYVGLPHRIVFRPHATFSVERCAYGGRALGIGKVKSALKHDASSVKHDIYGAILMDYDYDSGQGDVLEISGGEITYHVGYSDKSDPLTEAAKSTLRPFHSEFANREVLPRQPPGNNPAGWSFAWGPKDGEVVAAGPRATIRPFHLYASSLGPLSDAPPC